MRNSELHRRPPAVFLGLILAVLPWAIARGATGDPVPSDLQWPWWRGPYSNGTAVPADGPLATEPRLAWHSTEFTKQTGGTITGRGMTGGCQSLVMHDDRIYVAYFIGSQDPVVIDKKRAADKNFERNLKKLIEGGAGHTDGTPLTRVGIDDPEVVKRMQWNVHGEDVMVCLDAASGETLWKTPVPGAINNTGATYGPHLTPGVDPSTGRVYALGVDGRVLAFDGTSGELLWTNEERRQGDLTKAVAERRGLSTNRGGYEMVVALDGVVLIGGRALDGATGKELWSLRAHWFWLPWRYEGKWYLLNSGHMCVDPLTGRELWGLSKEEVRATDAGTLSLNLAVAGDLMVAGQECYRITPQGRELVWRNEDLIFNRMKGTVILDGIVYNAAYDPATVPAAREKLAEDFASGKRDRKDTRRHGKWLGEHLDRLAAHHSQGGHMVGLALTDGQPAKLGPPLGPSDNGGLMVGMGRFVYWKNKGGGNSGYYWLDTTATDMGVADPKAREQRLSAGWPNGSQTPACYKGRMYVRGRWSVACLDFNQR